MLLTLHFKKCNFIILTNAIHVHKITPFLFLEIQHAHAKQNTLGSPNWKGVAAIMIGCGVSFAWPTFAWFFLHMGDIFGIYSYTNHVCMYPLTLSCLSRAYDFVLDVKCRTHVIWMVKIGKKDHVFCFVLFCFVLFCFVLFCFVCLFVCLFFVGGSWG